MWSCLQAASWVISFCRICVPIVRTPPLSTIATWRKRTGRTAAIHAWGWNIKSCSTSIRSRPSTSKIGCASVGRTPAASGCVIPISILKRGGPTPGCARPCGTSWRLMSRPQSCCTPAACAPKSSPRCLPGRCTSWSPTRPRSWRWWRVMDLTWPGCGPLSAASGLRPRCVYWAQSRASACSN